MGRVLWFLGWWMAKSSECLGDVVGHGEIDSAFLVIPEEMDAAEDLAIAVNGDVVVFGEAGDEVVGVDLTDNLDSEVIYDKVEGGGTGDVAEKAWGVASWDVAIVGKVLDKLDVRKAPGLGKAVHSGTDFCKDAAVLDEGSKVIFFHDVIWDGPGWDVNIFILAGVIKGGD